MEEYPAELGQIPIVLVQNKLVHVNLTGFGKFMTTKKTVNIFDFDCKTRFK